MKPIIGILARSQKDNEDCSIFYANNFVVKSIVKCGGIPLLILPNQGINYEDNKPSETIKLTTKNKEDLNDILNRCDGILIPGGYKWYEYDEYICKHAVDNNIPLLGICAGMQILAKVLNNDKINGLDNTIINETYINHHQTNIKYAHKVRIIKDSLLYRILKKDEIKVNSRHNYHISNELSFLASAYAEDDVIEAVEYKENKFTLGVQWHPESMIEYDEDSKKIIYMFIESAKK